MVAASPGRRPAGRRRRKRPPTVAASKRSPATAGRRGGDACRRRSRREVVCEVPPIAPVTVDEVGPAAGVPGGHGDGASTVESLKPGQHGVGQLGVERRVGVDREADRGPATSSARIASTRTFSVPPAGPRSVDGDGAAIAKSPSRTMCETSSSGSCVPSGSVPGLPVEVAERPERGPDLRGRRRAAGTTCTARPRRSRAGAAIEVPDSSRSRPGRVDRMHLPGAIRSTSAP